MAPRSDSFPSNAQSLLDQLDAVIQKQRELSTLIHESSNPPPGPYAVFHHLSLLQARFEDLSRLVKRVGLARGRYSVLAAREKRYRPAKVEAGKEPSKRLRAIFQERHDLTGQLRLDVESLYIYANLALDQWALVIRYSLGLPELQKYPYMELVKRLQAKVVSERLDLVQTRHLDDFVWLAFQVRFYRNTFVEHVNRPWQRGSTMSVHGDDFNFFICTPPGWLPDSVVAELIEGIRDLAPAYLAELPADHWQRSPRAVLEATYRQIDQVPRQVDRERVWNVWKEIGGSTVSYDVWLRRFCGFMDRSMETVAEIVREYPNRVELGTGPV